MDNGLRPIRRALLSVFDKTGLVAFASELARQGAELISTGGTRQALEDAGMRVAEVSKVTQFPEMLGGRVKSLHPRIHAGILAIRDNPDHEAALAREGILPIDLVVCNLYPFERTVVAGGSSHDEIIEQIDVGGPSMVRAAAKNYRHVAVLTDPAQYEPIIAEMRAQAGCLTLKTRKKLAAQAFARTAAYDAAICAYFDRLTNSDELFPTELRPQFRLKSALRYGENPHQRAAFYVDPQCRYGCIATAETLHGKELSYNNILDLDSALNLVREFEEPAAVVIKHNNPCGAAVGRTLAEAFRRAYEGDPLSAYGGVLGFNREVGEETAALITEPNHFIECIIAPAYSDAGFHLLTTRPTWKKNVRLLRTGPLISPPERQQAFDYRRVDGGMLVQSRDLSTEELHSLRVVTHRSPTEHELGDLRFAWILCKHVKSNAIVLAKDEMLVGTGAGQMSRVDSVHMAVRKAGERSPGSVLASDAFFPFRDNIDLAHAAGVTAVIQPGGSIRDQDCVAACNEHQMAMVLTGVRHFRH